MLKQTHIQEEDLRHMLMEQETSRSIAEIESHVSDCDLCQKRLLEAAASSEWRTDFQKKFEGLPELDDHPETRDYSSDRSTNLGDEFDLLTVQRMLDELLTTPSHPEMLGKLGRYDVEEVIGCGGMGVVLRAFDHDLHRPVAIKLILPKLARNGTAKQRFAREARAAAAILHPNVIGIHGIEESGGVPWFVMPLVPGCSLQTLVDRGGPLREKEIVRIAIQIASGLAAAHAQGLVHRDIKPANILIDNEVNRVVITDFGLARCEAEESMTQTGWLAGTLNYMSPEQSRGETLDSRSDLFSLGGLLFYLATGTVPFRADSALGVLHKIGNESPPAVQSLNPEISNTLTLVIERLLEKSPSGRFNSAAELESLLTDYLAHLHQPHLLAAPKVLRSKHKISTGRVAAIGAASLIALFLGTLAWQTFSKTYPVETQVSQTLTLEQVNERYGLEPFAEFDGQLLQMQREIARMQDALDASAIDEVVLGGGLRDEISTARSRLLQLNESLHRGPASPLVP